MKFRVLFVAVLASLGALVPALRARDAAVPAPLHVVIRAHDPISFHELRHGLADGKELILSTLRFSADQEARFARYPGDVVWPRKKASRPRTHRCSGSPGPRMP